jgi:hypothetical protein
MVMLSGFGAVWDARPRRWDTSLSAIREGNTPRLGTPEPFFPISNLPFFGP